MAEMYNKSYPYHIVQTSYDDGVFDNPPITDTLHRQILYGRELNRLQRGSRLTILVLTKKKQLREFERENVRFVPVGYRFGAGIPFLIFKKLKTVHEQLKIDVVSPQSVHEDGWGALLFGKLFRIAVVGQIHYDIFSPHAQKQLMGNFMRKGIIFNSLPRYDVLRVVAKRNQDHLISKKIHSRVELLPVPVTISASNGKHPIKTNRNVLFVGRLVPEKNLEFWFDVAAAVCSKDPSVVFQIIGDGPLKENLKKKAETIGLKNHVTFLGEISYGDLSRLYEAASVFLLTSHFEGFGRVLVEAGLHKLPVVAPRIAGVEDIVEDGQTGFLFEPGNKNQAADFVATLLSDEKTRMRLGEQLERSVREKFPPEKGVKRWAELLIKAAERTKPHRSFLPAERIDFKKWTLIAKGTFSLLRTLEFGSLKQIVLQGKTMDVGGGDYNSYMKFISNKGTVESVNISPVYKPTLFADLDKPLPIPSESFDNILCFNTYEHIYNDQLAIKESFRILKKGGRFYFCVPFLYRGHGSPFDYHRHTAHWWATYLESCGLAKEDFVIQPFFWGQTTSAYSFVDYQRFSSIVRPLVTLYDLIKERLRPRVPDLSVQFDYALGFFIHGIKSSNDNGPA